MTSFTHVAEADTRPTGYRVILYTQTYDGDRPKGGGEWVIAQPTLDDIMGWVNSPCGVGGAIRDLESDAGLRLPDWSGWREIRLYATLLAPGELAADEADQLQYEGRVINPAKDLFLWRHITDKAERLREAA